MPIVWRLVRFGIATGVIAGSLYGAAGFLWVILANGWTWEPAWSLYLLFWAWLGAAIGGLVGLAVGWCYGTAVAFAAESRVSTPWVREVVDSF